MLMAVASLLIAESTVIGQLRPPKQKPIIPQTNDD